MIVWVSRLLQIIAGAVLATGLAGTAIANAQPSVTFDREVKRSDGGTSHAQVLVPLGESKGWVALVPSLGRGVEDFTELFGASLARDLVNRGYSVALIQPRGIGKSSGDLSPADTTMEILASDLEQVFDALKIDRVHLIGHAFGNRLSRYFAATRTERVAGLAVLAAGGDFELSPQQLECLLGSFDLTAPENKRLAHIECAFFADGNDPRIWLDGWHPRLARAQIAAAQAVESGEFKQAGGIPFLLVQPEQDFIAPPELAGRRLAEELADQVTYAEVAGAGHALLPEKPEEVAELVAGYLDSLVFDAAGPPGVRDSN